jgi:hypothetical protein
MKKQLDLEEQLTIASLMDDYRNIHDEINKVEKKLTLLSKKQEKLSIDLDNARQNEKNFGDYLKEKYGPGKLDTMTLEYITE